MTKLLFSALTLMLVVTGSAFAEGDIRPDPAEPLQPYSFMQSSWPQAGGVLQAGAVLPAGVASYATYNGHIYVIDPNTRRILRVIQ